MANEKRLIDANALLRQFNEGRHILTETKMRVLVEDAPTVDAVEVVRCKDCKHRADVLDCGNYLCNRKMIGMVRPEDFCFFGERRTDA